jgi:hypothetical protein
MGFEPTTPTLARRVPFLLYLALRSLGYLAAIVGSRETCLVRGQI